ncbi:MAG: hypothetical protein VW991_01870 [Aquiluna sp.]
MSYILIAGFVAIALALYATGLAGYRLLLSTKNLRAEVSRSESLVKQLRDYPRQEVIPAHPHGTDDLVTTIAHRRAVIRARRRRAEERQRRLVQRIRDIEVDKR